MPAAKRVCKEDRPASQIRHNQQRTILCHDTRRQKKVHSRGNMKRLMIILAIIAAIPAASALDMYYNLTMTYDKGQVSLGSVSIVPLTSYDLDYYNTLNDYTAIIMDENKALSIYYLNFNLWSHAVYSKNGELADSRDITLDRNTISA